ncbi:hypothetical protein D8T27_04450 [Vibrio vulnificus]|nr:hypothetical protein D8T27_04450 [Vibrio vulnificus]
MQNDFYWVVWLLTIISWIVLPFVNHKLTKSREKNSERNKTIKDIEDLFKDMNEAASTYFSSEELDLVLYYKLISYNEKLKFLLKRIQYLDVNYNLPHSIIREIRMLTTNDSIRTEKRLDAMRELIAQQTIILVKLPIKI